jgi:dipeptidyl aminopeptidase/acylaminoacyl peptidase
MFSFPSGGEKGLPYPPEEQDAVDTVMQFAIHGLGFKPENIIIFAWSIGGYTAAWAAKHYPDTKAVVSCTHMLSEASLQLKIK